MFVAGHDSSQPSAVRVARLNVTYLIPRLPHLQAELLSRLDNCFRHKLATACSSAMTSLCPDNDPSVWFIRNLDLRASTATSAQPEQIAEICATQMALQLARKLSAAQDGDEILHFSDRTAYLAQFLRDLADGAAWSKWYYAEFDGLRALATNAAIREAICREPGVSERALLELVTDGAIDKVLRAISERDCRTVLGRFCGGEDVYDPTLDINAFLQAAWRAWQRAHAPTDERASLRIYLALRSEEGAPQPAPVLRNAIYALLSLARWMNGSHADTLLTAIQRGDDTAVLNLSRSHDMESLGVLFRCKKEVVAEIAGQLRSWNTKRLPPAVGEERWSLTTPFGGVFHLLPRLDELNLEDCAETLPKFGGDESLALVRFLVLLKCLGAARAPDAFFDIVLRKAAGVAPGFDANDVRGWGETVTPAMAGEFQTRWALSCHRRTTNCEGWLRVHPARRGRVLLLADCERDTWLYAARTSGELVRFLEEPTEATEHLSRVAHHEIAALLCDPSLIGVLPPTIAGAAVQAWNSTAVGVSAAEDKLLATCLRRCRPPDEELKYLGAPSLLRGAQHLDLALSLAARALLRSFAWRLPGFAWSSVNYLYANFLDMTAKVEAETGHWLVRLTPPPLHIVLTMIGMGQDAYRLPWLEDQSIKLKTTRS